MVIFLMGFMQAVLLLTTKITHMYSTVIFPELALGKQYTCCCLQLSDCYRWKKVLCLGFYLSYDENSIINITNNNQLYSL